jgi:hypothetical protein
MAPEKTSIEQHDGAAQTLEELKHTQTIDTIHQDEAIRVLAQYAGDSTWTPEEEKKLVRRLDRKLMSLLIVTYGLQYFNLSLFTHAWLTVQVLRQGHAVTSSFVRTTD